MFGYDVAIWGDWIFVGARGEDVMDAPEAGTVYVYRDGGLEDKLTAPDFSSYDHFGFQVATDGKNLIVGAHFDTGSSFGSVYCFEYTTAWTFIEKLGLSGTTNDNFGAALAVQASTLIVGARFEDSGGLNESGSVYCYTRGSSSWLLAQRLVAPDAKAGDAFGFDVALDGTTLAVAAAFADQNAVYVFTRGAEEWTFFKKLVAPDRAANDDFGWGLSLINEDVILAPANKQGTGAVLRPVRDAAPETCSPIDGTDECPVRHRDGSVGYLRRRPCCL